MSYAIISVGGKQYRVREGERLLVDRLPHEEGATFEPRVLLIGGESEPLLDAGELEGQQVTARVAKHVLGKKIVIGKHKRRTRYRRRTGFRARLSQIEIEAIGKRATRAARPKAAASAAKAAARTAEAAAGTEVAAAGKVKAQGEAEKAPRRAARKKTEKTETEE